MAQLLITQVRSKIGGSRPQRETLRSLGLRRISDSTIREDGPQTRGMLRAVAHLVTVEPAPSGAGSQSSEETSA